MTVLIQTPDYGGRDGERPASKGVYLSSTPRPRKGPQVLIRRGAGRRGPSVTQQCRRIAKYSTVVRLTVLRAWAKSVRRGLVADAGSGPTHPCSALHQPSPRCSAALRRASLLLLSLILNAVQQPLVF